MRIVKRSIELTQHFVMNTGINPKSFVSTYPGYQSTQSVILFCLLVDPCCITIFRIWASNNCVSLFIILCRATCSSLCLYKNLVIGGYGTGHIRIFDTQKGNLMTEICAHAKWIHAMDLAPSVGLVSNFISFSYFHLMIKTLII